MASRDDDQPQDPNQAPAGGDAREGEVRAEGEAHAGAEGEVTTGASGDGPPAAVTTLGHLRYVHAAFFLAGVLASFLASKLLATAWGYLTDWPAAVKAVPSLLAWSEEDRGSITLAAGAVVGGLAVFRYYRQERVRVWASEVAAELAKVTWPTKEAVTNGTVIVVVASLIATVYVALLDRFWGFVTDLVYRV